MGKDVGNAHIIMRTIHRFWEAQEDRKKPLLVPQQDELKEYTENCKEQLDRLKLMLEKYDGMEQSLKLKAKFVIKNFFEDFASIRERLQRSTGNLAIFHSMLT
jgi:hypothetical protein